jgi:uncharacterized protein YdbL (DUF1318 family)
MMLLFAASCITINIYFPAAAVEEAADRIVEEVWGEQEKTLEKNGTEPAVGEPQSRLKNILQIIFSLAGPEEAFAQEADINITTPAIRKLKQSIQGRAGSIKPFLDSGNVGISRDGLLVLRSSNGLKLKDKATISRLLSAENKDREALYIEIAKANKFSMDKVPDIKKIFAGSWIKKAKKGWWYQNPDSGWAQK